MSDDCKDITIKKLKEILKEKKKSNNNIKLSGKKTDLCKQYLQHKTPKSNTYKPNAHNKPVSPKTQLYESLKKVAKSLNTIDDLSTLKHKLNTIIEQQITELKKNKKYVTSKDVITMMNKKDNMDIIVKQLKMIDDEYTREDVGTEVLEDATELLMKYERSDQRKFLETIGRTIDEDWLIYRWEDDDEKIVAKKLLKKESMNKIIKFLLEKKKDEYWTFKSLVSIEKDELDKLYSENDLKKFNTYM